MRLHALSMILCCCYTLHITAPAICPAGGRASLEPLLSRYNWSEHRPEISSHVLTHLSCPTLSTSELQSCDPHGLLEWLGAVDADINW